MEKSSLKNLLSRIDNLDHASLVTLVKKFYNQKEFFRKIFNLIKDSVVMIDEFGHILSSNSSAENAFNIKNSKNKVLWKCIPEILAQVDIAKIFKKSIISEILLTYPEEKIFQFYSIPFCEERTQQAICVFSDITQSLIEKSKEIEREKIDSILLLSAGVAHEIGNPLNSINLQLELMKNFLFEKKTEEISQSIDICKTEVERLHGVIKNFLQAVRPVKPNLTDVHLFDLLNFVVKFLSPELTDACVEISFNISGEIPIVLADPDQIKQVFFNIIKNSVEAMSSEKRILIKIFTDDDNVILQFIDNGIGIKDENIGKIFEPFSTSKRNGTGLGMFIVQRILRDHNARISIESKENKGTTITIKFPRKIKLQRMLNS